MNRLRMGHIELFVSDPLASLPFYRDMLGFEVVAVQEAQFVWLKLGEQEILLRPASQRQSPPATGYENGRFGLVLYTTDLDGTVASLRQRGLTLECMLNEPDCYSFTDPDGNWFQLVDPAGHT